MNVTTARTMVLDAALRAASDSALWTNQRMDTAMQLVMDWCNEKYKILTVTFTDATVSSTKTVDTSGETNFLPYRFLSARNGVKRPLTHVSFNKILHWHEIDTGSREPERIAFESMSSNGSTNTYVHPTPDAAYTYTLQYRDVPTSWTVGGADPGTLNIADHLLRPMFFYGASAAMQSNLDMGKARRSEKWAMMEEALQAAGSFSDDGIDQLVPDD